MESEEEDALPAPEYSEHEDEEEDVGPHKVVK